MTVSRRLLPLVAVGSAFAGIVLGLQLYAFLAGG
jgi:hypothetical protein